VWKIHRSLSPDVALVAVSVVPPFPVPGAVEGFMFVVAGVALSASPYDALEVLAPLAKSPFLGGALVVQHAQPTTIAQRLQFAGAIHPLGRRYLVDSAWVEGPPRDIIAAAKKSAPGKPIRHIVLSHFHDDHMGGVRTYAAEGAIVIVHSSAGDYIREVLGQRRALEPDRLEIARREGRQSQPPVLLVDDAITLTDGTREIKLYRVPNMHVSGILVGYVPDARVLFTADLVTDTFLLVPVFASTVQELIQENGLAVEMIACGHGNAMPYVQLAYALGSRPEQRYRGNNGA
jgi:glyoxylase-like metal-dependent hydrolase (beta-lactamase superfamily II)